MAGERRTPLGLIGSLLLHGSIIAATLFTFQHKLDIIDESTPVVPVDIVTLAAKTNVMPSVKRAPKIEPPKVVPQPPPPAPPPPPPAQDAEPIPSELVKPAPTPPKPKPPQKEEKKSFDVDNVLALLNKVAPAQKQTNARVADRDVTGVGAQNAMTADLMSILQSELQSCWSLDALSGAPHPENLVVTLDIFLSPDGSVARSPQLVAELSSSASDPYFRVAKETAVRALYECAPFKKLPADRYSQWREITFTFDPRKMMGG
jgi:hypothetical protein